MEIPTFQINADVLDNLMRFILLHESTLIHYGALKIQLMPDCLLALKKHKSSYTQIGIQNIMRAHENESIYMIGKQILNRRDTDQACLPIRNEDAFWTNLHDPDAYRWRSDLMVFLKKSFFYEKRHKAYFSLHRIPGQSLLQLLPPMDRKAFHRAATLAHGPGAIFPLAVTKYGLSSLIYHHNGGVRQWYVIPASERDALQKLIEQNNYPKCIHHDDLLIHPLVLDKYQIRYYRLLQQPNELVVLASGAVSQSFVTDTCWTESCMLALPSWIRDGHAFGDWSLCRDHLNVAMKMKMVKLNFFKHLNIDRYVTANLGHPNLIGIGPSNHRISPMLVPSTSNINHCGDQNRTVNNASLATEILVPTSVPILSISENFPAEVVPDETSIADDIYPETSAYESYEMDELLLETPNSSAIESVRTDTRPQQLFSNSPSNDIELARSDETNRRSIVQSSERNFATTLFVSGLSQNITEHDFCTLFIGSINVVLRLYHRSGKLLQYAFVTYRSSDEANRTLLNSFHHVLLGPNCSVQYLHERHMIFITNIPSHVDEIDLQRLFPNSFIIEYSPDAHVRYATNSSARYALISYDTEEEAKQVVINADQYRIRGQALSISLYCHNQQLETMSDGIEE